MNRRLFLAGIAMAIAAGCGLRHHRHRKDEPPEAPEPIRPRHGKAGYPVRHGSCIPVCRGQIVSFVSAQPHHS